MELKLVDQIFATVFIAFLLASLVAKLFSITLAADDDPSTVELNKSIECEVIAADHSKDTKSVGGFDSEEPIVLDFEQHQHHESLAEFLDQGKVMSSCGGELVVPESLLLEEQAEAVVESPPESTSGVEKTIKIEGLLVGDDEDDWEGVERSELDDNFAAAATFVANVEKSGTLTSDVHMQLDRLHKIATQGPCLESQPMPLMMSARAKWNSWRRKGSMSPEVAMEQYLSLLSDKVPGWMEDHHDTTL